MTCRNTVRKHTFTKLSFKVFVFILLHYLSHQSYGQTNRYWSQNFNEEASLLAGAVVGGGTGVSAIYYNPANISEIETSKLSVNASLFAIEFFNYKNALGNDINLKESKFQLQPRFISYLVQPKNNKRLSLEFAVLNNEFLDVEMAYTEEKMMDILTNLEGNEKYIGTFRTSQYFRDDWLGFGGSYKINNALSVGMSMFLSIKNLEYQYMLDIEAYPLTDTVYNNNLAVPFYSATAQKIEYIKFNNNRLIWKLGFKYKPERIGIGINITTPSVGLFSGGKVASGKIKQSNISNPNGNEFLPDMLIIDTQIKNEISVGMRNPLSIAFGFTYDNHNSKKTYFATIEYFNEITPYKMVTASINPNITTQENFEKLETKDWLSYAYGAKSVVNVALGYRWDISEDMLILTGFRTDFNYLKNLDYGELSNYNRLQDLNYNVYHITGGGQLTILKFNIIAGLQYSYGRNKNQLQLINMADPVEYNTVENAPLQGIRENTMILNYNKISLFFGGTFSFGTN